MAKKIVEKISKKEKKEEEKALPFDIERVVSERSFAQANESGKYTFYVPVGRNKIEVASVVEAKYKVKVARVNIVTVLGKSKSNPKNRKLARKSDRKKAIVTLEKGNKIEDFTKVS